MSVRMRGPGRWVTVQCTTSTIPLYNTQSVSFYWTRETLLCSAGAGWSPTQIVELRSMRPGHTRAVTWGEDHHHHMNMKCRNT